MAREWNAEETKDFMKKAGSEVHELCEKLNEETDWEKKKEIINEIMIYLDLISKADTAHKKYVLKQVDDMCSRIKKRFGLL